MICYFCLQAVSPKQINNVLKRVFEFVVTKMTKVYPQSREVFYSLRIEALKNTIWSKSDERKDTFLKRIKTCTKSFKLLDQAYSTQLWFMERRYF